MCSAKPRTCKQDEERMGTEDFEDTKLNEAVRYGDIDDVKRALKQGDNPNQIGIYQWNALHEAASNGDLGIVQLLLTHGGDPNKPDKLRGCTPVHYAAAGGHSGVLRALLKAGGLYDTRNNQDENCLDVATNFECQKLLREQRDKLVISQNVPKIVIEESVLSDTKRHDPNNNNDAFSDITSLCSDLDSISLATNSSTESRPHSRAWGPERVLGIRKELVLGYIQLSYEYNVKKETFKIRVWELADILLPPPETSMISTIYVKSYLQPDKRRETKRKTEEVRVEKTDMKEVKKKGQDRIVNFQPGCFKFTRALEYSKVTKSVIDSKIVDIEVCITQRYTRKSFVVATYNMPMKMACKKLVKEKFALKPCISTSLPENMKVYNANELGLSHSRGYSSNPNLCRSPSSSSSNSWATPYPDQRAISDSDLRSVSTDSGASKPSIEINVPEEEDEELQLALQQIAIMEQKERSHPVDFKSSKPVRSEPRFTNLQNEYFEGDEDGFEISVQNPVSMAEVQVHMPNVADMPSRKRKPDAGKKHRKSILEKLTPVKDPRKKDKGNAAGSPSHVEHLSARSIEDEESSIGLPSRPDTPTWDYYDDPPLFDSMVPIDIDVDDGGWRSGACLPMATTFDVPSTHCPTKPTSLASENEIKGARSKRKARLS